MTVQGNGPPQRYKVSMSAQTRAVLHDLHAHAIQDGTAAGFLKAVRRAIGLLHTDPLTFGEPQYRLPALRLMVRQAVVAQLVVDYAVHEDRPLVFIRGFKVLS